MHVVVQRLPSRCRGHWPNFWASSRCMLPRTCLVSAIRPYDAVDSLLIIPPHSIPSTPVVIEFLPETPNTISLVSTKVDSTSRVSVDTSITSDLSNLSELILRCQLTLSFDMERCYVLIAATWVCCTDWVGSVPCVAIWGWEGIGAFDDIDFTSLGPAVLHYSPPCGPLFISSTLAASGGTHSTAPDWHMVDIQNIYSLAISYCPVIVAADVRLPIRPCWKA